MNASLYQRMYMQFVQQGLNHEDASVRTTEIVMGKQAAIAPVKVTAKEPEAKEAARPAVKTQSKPVK